MELQDKIAAGQVAALVGLRPFRSVSNEYFHRHGTVPFHQTRETVTSFYSAFVMPKHLYGLKVKMDRAFQHLNDNGITLKLLSKHIPPNGEKLAKYHISLALHAMQSMHFSGLQNLHSRGEKDGPVAFFQHVHAIWNFNFLGHFLIYY